MSMLGAILVLVGSMLVVVEAHFPSHGVFGLGAAIAVTACVVLVLSDARRRWATIAAVVALDGALWRARIHRSTSVTDGAARTDH